MSTRVVVIGAGIAGLAAARTLAHADDSPQVTVLDASERPGGRIRTVPFAGAALDVGPDALLSRAPGAVELCRELGLGEDLVPPGEGPSFVWTRGALRPLPAGLLAGLPAGPGDLLRSRILSPPGVVRAGMDLVLPGQRLQGDESIGALVRRRLGRQVLERLIDPLLGGINAGHCDELSLEATAPHLAAAARADRSIIRGLRATVPAPPPGAPPAPVFLTLRGGLERLVDAVAADLGAAELRLGAPAGRIEQVAEGLRVVLASGERIDADHVVLATPAAVAAGLVRDSAPHAAAELGDIPAASVAVVALAFPRGAVAVPAGTGFVTARDEPLEITACTWATSKWPHLAAQTTDTIVKCSIGRAGEDAAVDLADDELVARARRALERTMGVRSAPAQTLVARHHGAFPQYAVGHLERVARVEAELAAALPGLELAGGAYRGVGVPSCITSGQAAARRVLAAPAPSPTTTRS
ncbi:MAG TPA: protoporphyrinogen oxidase [Solirubrobacteraceae bacterium]|nr:protoporphyrinogen oxidase [Solirubrobacteraceae bacterium]